MRNIQAAATALVFIFLCAFAPAQAQEVENTDKFIQPPRAGMWWNPQRSGHGLVLYYAAETMYLYWYTYDTDGQPVWYISAPAASIGMYWTAALYKVSLDAFGGELLVEQVGRIDLSFSSSESAELTWSLEDLGQGSGNEPIEFIALDPRVQTSQRTGAYFDPAAYGLGISVHEEGQTTIVVAYYYDDDGQPRWSLGAGDTGDTVLAMQSFMGFCPDCEAIDPTSAEAGFVTISPDMAHMDLSLNYPFASGGWQFQSDEVLALSDPAQTGLAEFITFKPSETGAQVSAWNQDHYAAINRQLTQQDYLLLFIPGSFGKPASAQRMLAHFANQGYAALGIRYPNDWPLSPSCNFDPDIECHRKLRREILYGVDETDIAQVAWEDSLLNRLERALNYLADTYPEDNWGRFLFVDGSVRWERVLLTGGSQGGGHAAFLAKDFTVARVALMSGSGDYPLQSGQSAPWLFDQGATPEDRYYGVSHVLDSGHSKHLSSWSALGMSAFGAPKPSDEAMASGSHQLTSDLAPAVAGEYHASTGKDEFVPTDAWGRSLYAEIWNYLLIPH